MDNTSALQTSTLLQAQQLGLNEEEYNKIQSFLGRVPNFTELSIYSVMWSEHCSYKNSIKLLKTLPSKGENLLVEAGEENAGLVDIGGGLACAFKIESHNHPSAIEPYQGAATGVGGIHRDIFTMGARPIAALNSLRFGNPKTNRTRHLLDGVVRGIGDYGNCLGVPTVGGEVYFDDCYEHDILVNAMSVGVVNSGETVSATAHGVGNSIFIVGSATGKDGIHGATFASADLNEESEEDLPSVQVGDPFQEKLLLEASLEAIATGAMVGMQDMGAAGICCSTSEMSAKGNCGMRIDLDLVPTRQDDMTAFEILLSESQERMLICCKEGREDELKAVFDKWDLECVKIGEVTEEEYLTFYRNKEQVAHVPAQSLVLGGGAPVYERERTEPSYMKEITAFDIKNVEPASDLVEVGRQLLGHPNICSKHLIYDQYDGTVRGNSISEHKACDAAVIRVKGTNKGLAMSVDCNSTYVHADPYKGAMIAVSEAARNLVASGAKPQAITNCLNFGNPYNPEVYYQFAEAIKGMGDACRAFETPVTGGNVSFYNQFEKDGQVIPVNPTPTIGMLGMLDDVENTMSLDFKEAGDQVLLIGKSREDIGCSVYLKDVLGVKLSNCPHVDLEEEKTLQALILELIEQKAVKSVHDISEGGVFCTVVECCLINRFGVELNSNPSIRKDAWLFGESQGRYIVSASEEQVSRVKEICVEKGMPFEEIGSVASHGHIKIDDEVFGEVNELKELYYNNLEKNLGLK